MAIGVAERTAQLNAANDELRNQTAELSKRNQEITLFSKMNDFLQRRAESSGHVRGKSRASYVAAFVALRIGIACP